MKTFKKLEEAKLEEERRLVEHYKATYPILKVATIYNSNNMYVESDNFGLDIYFSRTYVLEDIRRTCRASTSNNIPTEDEAIKKVRGMHQERDDFMEAVLSILEEDNE